MNIYQVLTQEHREVSQMLEQLLNTSEHAKKGREDAFQKLKQALTAHAEGEEKVFYPALKNVEDTRDLTLEAIEEHNLVKKLLSQLDGMPKDSQEWLAKLKVLKENVDHHVEEEEEELFEQAKQVLSDSQAQEMAKRFQQTKS